MDRLKIIISLLLCFGWSISISQTPKDSLGFTFENKTAFASKDYLPFWLVNNQDARFTDKSSDTWFEGGATGWYRLDSNLTLNYKFESVLKFPIRESFIKQYRVSLQWKKIQFIGGKFYNRDTDLASELRSGSYVQSRNAIPMTRVGFALEEYMAVPFTKGYVQFKGSWYHGWFEKDRALSNAWLHEKSAYLRVGKKLGFSWGLVHNAMWGGTDKFGVRWTRGFLKDYFIIFTGAERAEDKDLDENVSLEGGNRQGNHLGIWDIRLQYEEANNKFELYYERLWEDGWSVNHPFDKDAKFGFAWERKGDAPKPISAISVEVMSTTIQRGPGLPDSVAGQSNYGYDYGGRDDYYNNWKYLDGWTYEGRVIGNPLFITDERALKYFESINNYRVKVVNNRFWAIHLGVESKPIKNLTVAAKFTFSRNYGTYAGINGGRFKWGSLEPDFDNSDYPFLKPLNQLNTLIETSYTPKNYPNLSFNLGFAVDIGEMTKNYGGVVGFRLNLPYQ